MEALKTINPVESIGCNKTEVFVGANKLPKKMYRLIDSKGNDITEESVTHSELIEIILDSEVSRAIDADMITHAIDPEYRDDYRREMATEIAEECGYRILEVLV